MHKSRKQMASRNRVGVITLLCLLLSVCAEAGVPIITNKRVTDITTRSFAVILTISESSTITPSLFAADCTTPVTGYTSAIQQNSASGNIRVTVSGLSAATDYCYQLAATSASTSQPATSATAPVTTAAAIERTVLSGADILPTGNDIVKVPVVYLQSGETRDAITATVELLNGTAKAPLSLLLSANSNNDYFNFNNLFTTATGKSLHLVGGERVRITENHGSSGCVIDRYRTVPTSSGGITPLLFDQANIYDIDASGGVNILDILRVVGGKGSTGSGSCFNSDLDLNSDGFIDSTDLTIIKGGFNGLP